LSLSKAEEIELLSLVDAENRAAEENKLASYRPYSKQREFHAAGMQYRERLFRAGNQLGKTLAGAFEIAMHLTGRYPEWWSGKRFAAPVRFMAGSESAELTRKGVQRLLVGIPEDRSAWGTGAIPKACLSGWSMRSGVADALASITVAHVTDGIPDGNSTLQFASYDQGRTKWQADTLDGVWFDEEPPEDVYLEGITRTNTTAGPVILTSTLLKGMTKVVARFLGETSPDRIDICMTINDAEHYTQAERDRIIDSYPKHERDARTKGIPSMGSGLIFPVEEEMITVESFSLPAHWPRLVGGDFGWDHPSAWVWLAWDRETDTVYIYDVLRMKETLIPVQAAAISGRGKWIPVAWPHDGYQVKDAMHGEQLAAQYRAAGANMRPEHAHFEDSQVVGEVRASRISTEAGIQEMLTRMQSGRLRVFSHLNEWFEESRMYHRKNGLIVKERDDLMSATRMGIMDLRYAITEPRANRGIAHTANRDWFCN
jgi:phage terminase large subunit-like protein